MKAMFNNTVIAESDRTILIEGNHYFPPDSVHREYLRESSHRSTCPWKGEAHYYDVIVNDESVSNAAWSYPQPKDAAKEITGHVAFWKRVQVTA